MCVHVRVCVCTLGVCALWVCVCIQIEEGIRGNNLYVYDFLKLLKVEISKICCWFHI